MGKPYTPASPRMRFACTMAPGMTGAPLVPVLNPIAIVLRLSHAAKGAEIKKTAQEVGGVRYLTGMDSSCFGDLATPLPVVAAWLLGC